MLLGYIIIASLIILDQGLKLLSVALAPQGGTLIKVIIDRVFEFHYLVNRGASFGMLQDKQWLFMIITVLALVLFGYLFTKVDFKNKKVYSIAVVLLLAGTLGNAIDRVFRDGGVIDMIRLPFLNNILELIKIPGFTFNLADLYLTVAIVLYVVEVFFLEGRREKKQNEIQN